MDYTYSPQRPVSRKKRLWRWLLLIILAAAALWFASTWVKHLGNATITVVNRLTGGSDNHTGPVLPKLVDDPEYAMPENDKNRLDILVLGMRGKDDVENGGLLTDTMLLFSMDTGTGRAALTSIPRDLTVRVTDTKTEKINAAYIYNGLNGTRKLLSRITGTGIDNVVVVDFAAFQHVVEAIGGITITLDKPFIEKQQWGYEFNLPTGPNTLNGEQALYYVRSRYGSSDFDRSRRQMQVMVAIKNRLAVLDLASDPLKALQVIQTVRKHIETDLNIFDLGTLKDLISQGGNLEKIRRYQLTTDNVLYEATIDGAYELLPRDNTLNHIKEFFRTVLTDTPVLPTPSADTSPRTPTFSASPTPTP